MLAGIGVLIVVTAAVKLSNASFNIPALWRYTEKASTGPEIYREPGISTKAPPHHQYGHRHPS